MTFQITHAGAAYAPAPPANLVCGDADDETLVRKVSTGTDVADAIIGFHSLQAAEKLIKGMLAARKRSPSVSV